MCTANLCQVILMCYVEFYFCENSRTIIVLMHQHAATADLPRMLLMYSLIDLVCMGLTFDCLAISSLMDTVVKLF